MYIDMLKESDRFVADFLFCVDRLFSSQMRLSILKQITELIDDWEGIRFEKGEKGLREFMGKKFGRSSRAKMMWSMGEIELAKRQLQRLFN